VLLIGNKPIVSYFQVFRSKCYVLQKRSKSSKFAPKIYEGFLLGYDSNSHTYRVFNIDSGCVEITCDVVFWGRAFASMRRPPQATLPFGISNS
jgi:hypothetical protein